MLGLCSLSLAIVIICQIGLSRQGVTDSSDCAVNGDGNPNCSTANPNLSPLIILNGSTASKMYVDGHGSSFPSNLAYCGAIPSPYSGTFSLKAWLAYAVAISDPLDFQKCILYMTSLSYDSASGTYTNRTGLNVTFTARRPIGLLLYTKYINN
ncbi:hypothetical protein niasHT_029024 [Heterodera trifolii]|uniref:Effector protein n=1 Tax=Heterodera trifolii TaxID=157864 RepID=A0ABD2K8I9_9BILA